MGILVAHGEGAGAAGGQYRLTTLHGLANGVDVEFSLRLGTVVHAIGDHGNTAALLFL